MKQLTGKAANKGKVKGTARVLRSLDDTSDLRERFQAGEILIAPFTHPGLVIYMRKAAAIITERGGLLSHASLVSREMGKPCIVDAKDATKLIRDGMEITVDASNGIIYYELE